MLVLLSDWHAKSKRCVVQVPYLIAATMSSYLAGFSSRTVRSTTETSAVGTRKAMPVSLPFSSGRTLPTACRNSMWSLRRYLVVIWTLDRNFALLIAGRSSMDLEGVLSQSHSSIIFHVACFQCLDAIQNLSRHAHSPWLLLSSLEWCSGLRHDLRASPCWMAHLRSSASLQEAWASQPR